MKKFCAYVFLILSLLNTPQVSSASPEDDKALLQSTFQDRDLFLFFMILIGVPDYFRQTLEHFNSFYRAVIEDGHREENHEQDLWMQYYVRKIRSRMISHLQDYFMLLEDNTVTGLITNYHISLAIDEIYRIRGEENLPKEESKEEGKEEEKDETHEGEQIASPLNFLEDIDVDAMFAASLQESNSMLEMELARASNINASSSSSSSSSSSNSSSVESLRRVSANPGFYIYAQEEDFRSPPWLVPRELIFQAIFMNQHMLPAFISAHITDPHVYELINPLSSYELNEVRQKYEKYVQYTNMNAAHALYQSGAKRKREEDVESYVQPYAKIRESGTRPVYVLPQQWIPREESFDFFENIDEHTLQVRMQGGHFFNVNDVESIHVEHINIGVSFESAADSSLMRSGVAQLLKKLLQYPNLKRITVSIGSHSENIQFVSSIQSVLLHPDFIARLRMTHFQSIAILMQRIESIEIRNLGMVSFSKHMSMGYPNFMTLISNFQNALSVIFGSNLSMREFFPVHVQYISGLGAVYYHKLVFYFK